LLGGYPSFRQIPGIGFPYSPPFADTGDGPIHARRFCAAGQAEAHRPSMRAYSNMAAATGAHIFFAEDCSCPGIAAVPGMANSCGKAGPSYNRLCGLDEWLKPIAFAACKNSRDGNVTLHAQHVAAGCRLGRHGPLAGDTGASGRCHAVYARLRRTYPTQSIRSPSNTSAACRSDPCRLKYSTALKLDSRFRCAKWMDERVDTQGQRGLRGWSLRVNEIEKTGLMRKEYG